MKLFPYLNKICLLNLYFIKMEKPSIYFMNNKIKKIQIQYEERENNAPMKNFMLDEKKENYDITYKINIKNEQTSYPSNDDIKSHCQDKPDEGNVYKNINLTKKGNKKEHMNDSLLNKRKVKTEYVIKQKQMKREKEQTVLEEGIKHVHELKKRKNKNVKSDKIKIDEKGVDKKFIDEKGVDKKFIDEKGVDKKIIDEKNVEFKRAHFLLTYNKLKEMRKDIIAPVDKYGCDKLSEKTNDMKVFRFQTLISCMLSSRTKDEVTAMVMDKLKKHGLTVHNILNTTEEQLKKLIYGIGFYNVKAKQILQICHILKNKYNSDIPHTYEELKKLPGIGEKIAQLILQTALNKHEGIAVDIHVHRIANRLNWVNSKNELDTQMKLKSYVQKELWSEINHVLVGFGQVICKGKKPLCEKCTLTNKCQYYQDTSTKQENKSNEYI
ncbi:endonuclease III [Plasmodium falciparum UGT5.1]|uniref:Endonuclease III homolog n=5 Tax=Plasmodium falciparum TaxID=5833 RepID=C6KSY9_PLAF7|nr:endonuclease III-like protein 1, putative [Plasmodium falciparum 3D7]ETW31672.1 endonuclease III [Plasmodium falciparum FCH/4]ETW37813.1 endonuclease III [Plasmodium falciparum Tanzania (2000708)]EWC77826.1 endonuclease III [Plasmodium falciparum UGT5.1]EWC89875.1 endonuclease III [Plasmodium falciparum NF54]KAF4327492.1 endonuclease III-like [Plasmodium falciparum NF54]|eukprot:XP_966134.2 endonuclease III homologue, putative [Plasmodium falciparum 3D7]